MFCCCGVFLQSCFSGVFVFVFGWWWCVFVVVFVVFFVVVFVW